MLRRLLAVLAALSLLPLVGGDPPGGRDRGAGARRQGPDRSSRPRSRRTGPRSARPSTASRTSPGRPSATSATAAATWPPTPACARCVDTLITGRGERSLWFGQNARYDDQVTLKASNLQVDAFVTDLRNRRVVEKLLDDKVNGPGSEAREMVRGYVAGANRWLQDNKVTDPACKKHAYLADKAEQLGKVTELDLWYGVYMANLLASSGVFVKEIVDATPPSPTDPGVPDAGTCPLKVGRPEPTRSRPRSSRVSAGTRSGPSARTPPRSAGDRTHDQARHDPRQPALPLARPLPLHPAAPDDPRQVRRRRRLAGRLAGGQHRLEQAGRVEPHRLHGVPLHAVRVPARWAPRRT